MTIEAGQERRARAYAWLPWLALALAWFATAQVRPLFDPDEGRYAEIPREMLLSGDWVTPRFDGLKYFEKPPLQYWATATIYRLVGVHEWSSRLWTVGLAFACLAAVYGWTRRLYGPDAARIALVALAVSPFFLVVGHLDLLDPGFTLWLTAAVLAFTLAQSAPQHSDAERRWMLAAWVAAALAVLTKGIVVGVLAGSAHSLSTACSSGTPGRGGGCIRGPGCRCFWCWPRRGSRSCRCAIRGSRSSSSCTSISPAFSPRYTSASSPGGTSCRCCSPARCRGSCRSRARCGPPGRGRALRPGRPLSARRAPSSRCKFLLIYALLTLVFFSFSDSKLAPYILPMFPVLAAVTGAQAAGDARFTQRAAWIGAVLVPFVALGLFVYSALHNSYVPHEAWAWALAGTVAAAGGLAALLPGLRAHARAAAGVTALSAILAWQCLLCAYGVIPPSRSARDLVAAVRPYVGPQTRLYSIGQYRETVSPYLGRTLTLVAYEGELQFGLNAEPGRQSATPQQFATAWDASRDAVAFFDPGMWDEWRRRGLPGRVIAADSYTVAVSRW